MNSNYNNQINSVINDGSNLLTAFNRVLNYFDPNKEKNFKSKILDCSYSFMTDEKSDYFYNIWKTKNLTGDVLNNKFDIIIYEPPKNYKFYKDATNSSKIFSKIIKPDGIVIVKTNDFKNGNKLQGSFEIWDIFSNSGFYLFDNIIYSFLKPTNIYENYNNCSSNINHIYFMIFKKFLKSFSNS